jgi:hypothetical protein
MDEAAGVNNQASLRSVAAAPLKQLFSQSASILIGLHAPVDNSHTLYMSDQSPVLQAEIALNVQTIDLLFSCETVVFDNPSGAATGSVGVGFLMPFSRCLADLFEAIVLGRLGRWLQVLGLLHERDHSSCSCLAG